MATRYAHATTFTSPGLALLTLALAAGTAAAEPPTHLVDVSAGASNFEQTGELNYRALFASGLALGADAYAGRLSYGFVAGLATDSGTVAGGQLMADVPLGADGPVIMLLRVAGGARYVAATVAPGMDSTTIVGGEVGLFAQVAASERLAFELGVANSVRVAVDPESELEQLGQPLRAMARYRIAGNLDLFARTEAGAAFGYGGDGAKFVARAMLGVGLHLDVRARARGAASERTPSVVPYVATGWHGHRIGAHLSHGPGLRAGARFLGGHLRVGLAGFARPGPINARTFTVTPSESYKGQNTLDLRSDGSFFGVEIAPIVHTRWARIAFPVTVGQAGFGFYLHGDDRETPDGRRVSEWEDQLFDGRDSSIGLGVSAGVELGFRLPRHPWLTPYVAAHWLQSIGYDTFVLDNYSGPSFAAGIEIATPGRR